MGCQQVKRTRLSGYATFDTGDNEGKHNNNPTWNVPVHINGSYTTSTPKTSHNFPKRKMEDDVSEVSKDGQSSPKKKTFTEVDIEHKDPEMVWDESKLGNTKKKSYSMDLQDIDDDDIQRGDDVIFVKEVTSQPEHVFSTNTHTASLYDQLLAEKKSENNLDYQEQLWRIANTIIPMSKDTPIGDGRLVESSASFIQQSIKIKNAKQNNDKILNEVKLNSKLNIDTYKNVPREQDLIRVSSTDSSDSDDDVEVVPLQSSTSQKIDHKKNLARIDDAFWVSDITLKVNSQEIEAGSSSSKGFNEWLVKKGGKYFVTLLKTPEKLNDVPQNEESDIDGAGLSILEFKNKTDLLKLHENNYAPQESEIVSGVKTVQNDSEINTTTDFLARLEAEYFSTPTKIKENLIIPRHEDNAQDDIRSYLPAASRNWLSELDAKYKTPAQKQNLNNTRQEVANVSKVYSEDQSPKQGSTDWLAELKYRLNAEQNNKQKARNDASRKSVIVKNLNINQNKSCSHKPDTTRETLSKSDLKSKTEQPIVIETLNNSDQSGNRLTKVNTEQNEARSFKFNTSEDLMLKLGSLYKKCQQEIKEKRRKSLLYSDEIKQLHREINELSKSKTESDVEMQSNIDLPALTPEQEKLVDSAFELEPETEMLVEKFNMRIHRRDLTTLANLNWLNDEVINFYMNLIMQRSENRKHLPKVYATNTFFYPKFKQGGQAGLRRWTRKVDIFAYDLFVVPVNIDNHWCLSIVDFRKRIIKYLDSRGRPNQECLDAILQYLKDEHQDKKGATFDVSGWKTECVKDIPQQMNGSDCGMFACTFAEFSSRGAAYSFTQAHMPYLRRKAALEILMGKLLL